MSIQQSGPYAQLNGAAPVPAHGHNDMARNRQLLAELNEQVWLKIGMSGDRFYFAIPTC